MMGGFPDFYSLVIGVFNKTNNSNVQNFGFLTLVNIKTLNYEPC